MLLNRGHAAARGTGREELLELVRWDEAGLAVPEMDLLACLMHELANAEEARTELYLRVARGRGAARAGAGEGGGALLHCVKVKEFDRLGRVVRVRLRIDRAICRLRNPRSRAAGVRHLRGRATFASCCFNFLERSLFIRVSRVASTSRQPGLRQVGVVLS